MPGQPIRGKEDSGMSDIFWPRNLRQSHRRGDPSDNVLLTDHRCGPRYKGPPWANAINAPAAILARMRCQPRHFVFQRSGESICKRSFACRIVRMTSFSENCCRGADQYDVAALLP